MRDNLKRLKDIVGLQLGIDPETIKANADFTKDLGADSLDVLELVMTIESEFDLDIEDQLASKIATIQDALDYIEGTWL